MLLTFDRFVGHEQAFRDGLLADPEMLRPDPSAYRWAAWLSAYLVTSIGVSVAQVHAENVSQEAVDDAHKIFTRTRGRWFSTASRRRSSRLSLTQPLFDP